MCRCNFANDLEVSAVIHSRGSHDSGKFCVMLYWQDGIFILKWGPVFCITWPVIGRWLSLCNWLAYMICWPEHTLEDTYRSSALSVSSNALRADVMMGIYIVFQRPLTDACTALTVCHLGCARRLWNSLRGNSTQAQGLGAAAIWQPGLHREVRTRHRSH